MLYNACSTVLNGSRDQSYINSLQDWCEEYDIAFGAVIDFLTIREDIIEQIVSIGLNPFLHKSVFSAIEDDFINEVTKIKYCIYESFRLNMLTLKDGVYYTDNGAPVVTPALFQKKDLRLAEEMQYEFGLQSKPKYLVHSGLTYKMNRASSTYDLAADRVSMMDGYVRVDHSFVHQK